jgi:peptidyl-prolyl cis-trans isomerase D
MLNLMRKKAGSWVIKILLLAIIIVFIFWGLGGFDEQKDKKIASVNNEPVSFEEYQDMYNSIIEDLRRRFESEINDDLIKMLQVKTQALNRIIEKKLLISEAKRLKLNVSDQEVAEKIKTMGSFQKEGAFDHSLYKNVLTYMRMTPDQFEYENRMSMLVEKLRLLITSGVKVSDLEARQWYEWENASVNIEFVVFDPAIYKDIPVSDKEVEAFFSERKEFYKTEPKIKAQYIHFNPEAYKANINISEEQLQEYYESNPDEFKKSKTVQARHILFRTDKKDDTVAVEKVREKAVEVLKLAKGGKDFSELAKQYSEGPSKDSGGYLGEFRKKDMLAPFSDKAFSMQPGEISDPVLTRIGWHIIKVEKVNEESTVSFNDAKPLIYKKKLEETAANLAYNDAEKAYNVSFEGDDLINMAKEQKLKVHTTDFFATNGPEGLLDSKKFASIAFSLSLMEISDIIDLGNGYYILQVIEKEPEKIPEFEDVKQRVTQDFIKDRQNKTAKADAVQFLSDLKKGRLMHEESKKYNLSPVVSRFFKRNETPEDVGIEKEIIDASFKLSSDKMFPEDVIPGSNGYYVIKFLERKTTDAEAFDDKKKNIKQALLEKKSYDTFTSWLDDLKKNSEIVIEKGFLD